MLRLGLPPALAIPVAILGTTTASVARPGPLQEVPSEVRAIVEDLTALEAAGSPGGLSVFGPRAWPLVVGGEVPVVAAAPGEGKRSGRVLALTQDAYLLAETARREGVGTLLRAGVRWLGGGRRHVVLGALGDEPEELADALGAGSTDEGLEADVLVVKADALRPERLADVRAFLARGGGVLCAVTPWGWTQTHPGQGLARELTLNRLLSPFGLAFDARVAAKRASGGFAVPSPDALDPLLRADEAWSALPGETALDAGARARALRTLDAALLALDDNEPTLMLRARRFLRDPSDDALAAHVRATLQGRELAPFEQRFGPWWIAGPFASGSLGRGDAPLGRSLEIEKELARCGPGGPGPRLDHSWKTRGGKLPWRRVDLARWSGTLDVGALDLAALAGRALSEKQRAGDWAEDAAVFLVRTVDVESPGPLRVCAETRGGIELRLDGELLGSAYAAEGAARVDGERQLARGRHTLWVRCVHAEGPWTVRVSGGEGIPAARVNAAIDAGVASLLAHQFVDGSWRGDEGYGAGRTALILYALAKCGLPPDHPAIRRGLAYLDAHPGEFVYSLSTELLARSVLDPGGDATLRAGAQQLAAWQVSSGLWAYPVHPGGGMLPDDLSNAVFAALALDACARRDVDVPASVWRELLDGTLACQERRGGPTTGETPLGLAYRPGGTATGAMTTAGLAALTLARARAGGELAPRDRRELDRAIEAGARWLGGRMDFARNPGQDAWQYFWIWGVERVGSLLGVSELGGVDWYRTGAEYLLGHQAKDGGWSDGHGELDTALALLFLKRATAPTSGDGPPLDWRRLVSGEARDDARPNRSLRVDARRPRTTGEELECWVELEGATHLPARVRWFLEEAGARTEIAVVEAEADRERGRFATRIELGTGVPLGLVARAEWPDGFALETTPLAIPARYSAETLEVAALAAANLLAGAEVTASSTSEGWRAEDAIDGRAATDWIARADDGAPTWRAELAKPARAGRLVLLPYGPSPHFVSLTRVTRVRVTLDGATSVEADLSTDPFQPTTIELDAPVQVSELELTVLATNGGHATGFAEVFLLP